MHKPRRRPGDTQVLDHNVEIAVFPGQAFDRQLPAEQLAGRLLDVQPPRRQRRGKLRDPDQAAFRKAEPAGQQRTEAKQRREEK